MRTSLIDKCNTFVQYSLRGQTILPTMFKVQFSIPIGINECFVLHCKCYAEVTKHKIVVYSFIESTILINQLTKLN